MRSDEFAQRWLAPDLGRLWEVATVLGVRPDGSDAATGATKAGALRSRAVLPDAHARPQVDRPSSTVGRLGSWP